MSVGPGKVTTARCACGQASIEVRGAPTTYSVCSCTNCKRRTGSAFGTNSYFRKADVAEPVGTTAVWAFHVPGLKSDQRRHFCPTCGTTLFWFISDRPDEIGIAAGCFGEDSIGEPNTSWAHAKKSDWVTLPAGWRVEPDFP